MIWATEQLQTDQRQQLAVIQRDSLILICMEFARRPSEPLGHLNPSQTFATHFRKITCNTLLQPKSRSIKVSSAFEIFANNFVVTP